MRTILSVCALLAFGGVALAQQDPAPGTPPAPMADPDAPAADAGMAKPMKKHMMKKHMHKKMHSGMMMKNTGGNNDAISGPGGGHSHYQVK